MATSDRGHPTRTMMTTAAQGKIEGGLGTDSEADLVALLDEPWYLAVCNSINLDTQTRDKAAADLRLLAGQFPKEFPGRLTAKRRNTYTACALFFAGRKGDGRSNDGLSGKTTNNVTVSQLLRATTATMPEFFDGLNEICQLLDSNPDVAQARPIPEAVRTDISTMQRKFVVLSAISEKLSKVFEQVFVQSERQPTGGKHSHSPVLLLRELAWISFVVCKNTKLPESASENQLVLLFQLLVCSLGHAVSQTPAEYLRPEYRPFSSAQAGQPAAAATAATMSPDAGILQRLAADFEVSTAELEAIHATYWKPFQDDAFPDPASLRFAGHRLPALEMLNRRYDELYMAQCDFDERLWLRADPAKARICTPSKPPKTGAQRTAATPLSARSLHKMFVGRNLGVADPTQTPVRRALRSVDTLHSYLEGCQPVASQSLVHKFFQACAQNPHDAIKAIIEEQRTRFLAACVAKLGKLAALAEQRFVDGVKLYYKVLEEILEGEAARLGLVKFDALLGNPVFHTSLLACVLEVVMVTYGVPWPKGEIGAEASQSTDFPWVLKVANVHAYDFFKVIESVVRCLKSLGEVAQHLHEVESQVLLRLAWTDDSPIWSAIDRADVPTASQCTPSAMDTALTSPSSGLAGVGHTALPSSKATARPPPTELYFSPRRAARPKRTTSQGKGSDLRRELGQSSVTAAARSHSGERSRSLDIFLRKVYHLAERRLQHVCGRLGVGDDVFSQVWTCFERSLVAKAPVLLKARHIDHLLLCALYGVCKVSAELRREIKFKAIVTEYASLTSYDKTVCRHVLLERAAPGTRAADEYGDVIKYYNRVYMPQMKAFILQYDGNTFEPPISPVPARRSTHKAMQLPGSQVYLSPLRQKRATRLADGSSFLSPQRRSQNGGVAPMAIDPSMTPRSLALYSFPQSPMRAKTDLSTVNATLTQKGGVKRLFSEAAREDGSPSTGGSDALFHPPKRSGAIQRRLSKLSGGQ